MLIDDQDYQLPLQVIEKGEITQPWRFELSPLDTGYGHTLGNALRRVLLSSIKGVAITAARFEGIDHGFSTVPGVLEDLVQIQLQLKKIAFTIIGNDTETITLKKSGKGIVLAKDIDVPGNVTIANPDLQICELTEDDSSFAFEATLQEGFGYWPVDDRSNEDLPKTWLALDSVFSPIINVSYRVEPAQKDSRADLDRLTMTITTNGTVSPEDALRQAASVLVKVFAPIAQQNLLTQEKPEVEATDPTLNFNIDDELLGFDVRVVNALQKNGIQTVQNLVDSKEADLFAIPNLGKTSISTIKENLASIGEGYTLKADSNS